jgi:integrase
MPRDIRGSVYKTSNGYGIRWPENGGRPQRDGFKNPTEARRWLAETVLPRLRAGGPSAEITFDAFCDLYLAQHPGSDRTKQTQRERLVRSRAAFGAWTLRELEGAPANIAAWRASLPTEAMRHRLTRTLREVLAAAVRWRYITRNPAVDAGPNPEPRREEVQPLEPDELAAICDQLGSQDRAAVILAAETGLRTHEWVALERRDIDRSGQVPVVSVRRRLVRGVTTPYLKTDRSRRRVPLTRTALAAVAGLPPRLATPALFPAPEGGPLLLDNWRTRSWYPALELAGVSKRGPYNLRHTFASERLHAGMSAWKLARAMGTSQREIDRTYGHLVRDSEEALLAEMEVGRDSEAEALLADMEVGPAS